jgi:hypothetical protein
MTKITTKTPFNTPVRWKADFKPVAAMDVPARLLSVKGKVAMVAWQKPEGESVQAVYRDAIEPA